MDPVQTSAAYDDASASESGQVNQQAEMLSTAQQAQHAQHHDASQPWASAQTQPALPVVAVPADRLGLSRRRATAAARSLSWSHAAAEDQPLNSQRSSGRPYVKPGGIACAANCSKLVCSYCQLFKACQWGVQTCTMRAV